MFTRIIVVGGLILAGVASGAQGATLVLPAQLGGEDERVDAPDPCPQEAAFVAGIATAATSLRVGGNSYGCDSEWAACLQFDLGEIPTGQQIESARLVVRKTGYADGAAGFAIVGAFPYLVGAGSVLVPRDDLSTETALAIVSPPAANVDLEFVVTGAVQNLLDDGDFSAGFLLCGVYNEAGYLDSITVGNTTNAVPPRLVVEYQEGSVPVSSGDWSSLKALFR